jgi:putative copper export protein
MILLEESLSLKGINMIRIIALIIMIIPGALAAYGVKLMRDMVFGILQPPFSTYWLQFLIGLFLFLAGLGFIAGFVLRRDRKRNKVQARFRIPTGTDTTKGRDE